MKTPALRTLAGTAFALILTGCATAPPDPFAGNPSVELTPEMLTQRPARSRPAGPVVLTAGDGHGAIVYASHLAARRRSDPTGPSGVAGATDSGALD